jgi:hypothetical protein
MFFLSEHHLYLVVKEDIKQPVLKGRDFEKLFMVSRISFD